jgi:hypothetical protein
MPLRSRGCFYSLELTKDQFRTALAFTHVERPSSGSTRASSMKMRSPLCSISSSFGAGSSLIAHRQSRFARIIRHVPFYNSHSHSWWCSLGSLCGLQNCRCFLAHCKHSGTSSFAAKSCEPRLAADGAGLGQRRSGYTRFALHRAIWAATMRPHQTRETKPIN